MHLPRVEQRLPESKWTLRNKRDSKSRTRQVLHGCLNAKSCSFEVAFGYKGSAPKKAWISARAFSCVQFATLLRRAACSYGEACKWALLRATLCLWKSVVHVPFVPLAAQPQAVASSSARGWKAVVEFDNVRAIYARLCLHTQSIFCMLGRVQLHVQSLVHSDRAEMLDKMAAKAQSAALHHDYKGAFGVVRTLSGFKVRRL